MLEPLPRDMAIGTTAPVIGWVMCGFLVAVVCIAMLVTLWPAKKPNIPKQ